MKKPVIALAFMSAAGCVLAQSSVQLFGVADASLQHISNQGGPKQTRLGAGGYSTSRIGMRGVEDLGGGLNAGFWIEMGFNADDGTGVPSNTNNQASGGAPAGQAGGQGLTLSRRSIVTLGGPWGELRAGREYVPHMWNLALFDPFNTNGVGTAQNYAALITGVTNTRASNSLSYALPRNIGGVYGEAIAFLGENASTAANSGDGNGAGFRLGYTSGPANIAVGYGGTKYAAGDVRQGNIGASWDFGAVKIMGNVSTDRNGTTNARGWLIGVHVPVGKGIIRAGVSQYQIDPAGPGAEPRSRKMALGYVHNLSKRTALYTTVAQVRNSGGSAAAVIFSAGAPRPNGNSTGLDMGIRHSF